MIENRDVISVTQIEDGLSDLENKLRMRLEEKGYHSWNSRHEILGLVTEEVMELTLAIKLNVGIEDELLDVAVAAIYGYINVKNGKLDW